MLVDQGLVAVVWRRKTDQERRDLDLVAVPYLRQPATCPVRAWLAWQEAAGLTSGPAFRPVHPRARLDSPQAPAIRAQLQAARDYGMRRSAWSSSGWPPAPAWPTPTATPATRPVATSRPS